MSISYGMVYYENLENSKRDAFEHFWRQKPNFRSLERLEICIDLDNNSYQLNSKFQRPNFNRFVFFAKID